MGTVDLDAARAARREANGEAPKVVFGGREFVMPVELPFGVVSCLGDLAAAEQDGDSSSIAKTINEVLSILLGDQHADFMALAPSEKDIQALVSGIVGEYGFADVGESQASAASSQKHTKRSRQTSRATTASTSAKPSGAKTS